MILNQFNFKGYFISFMKKLMLIFFAILFYTNIFSQKTNRFKTLLYDRVVMYDFESEAFDGLIVDSNGVLIKKIKKRVLLDQSTIDAFNHKLAQRSSFGGGFSNCFIPHLGFVYYYRNRIVAHISICMDCYRILSSIPIPGKKKCQFITGPESFYSADEGMSRPFRKFLKTLLLKNRFSHIPDK